MRRVSREETTVQVLLWYYDRISCCWLVGIDGRFLLAAAGRSYAEGHFAEINPVCSGVTGTRFRGVAQTQAAISTCCGVFFFFVGVALTHAATVCDCARTRVLSRLSYGIFPVRTYFWPSRPNDSTGAWVLWSSQLIAVCFVLCCCRDAMRSCSFF